MSKGGSKRSVSKTSKAHGDARLRSVLVPVDLSPIADRVLGRVARLPLADAARVTLLHVVPKELVGVARQRAERDAAKALATEARVLSKALPKRVHVEAQVRIGSAAKEIAKSAKTAKAELIVVGRGGGRALRDVFLGSTAERVIRQGRLPVLAVRLPPRAPYEHPAVAIELDDSSRDVIAAMLRVLPRPSPRVTLIHAFDTPYQGIYPSLTEDEAEHYRDELTRKATLQLTNLFTSATASAEARSEVMPPYKPHVRCGSARLVIEKAVEKAESDLLVLGTHGYSGLAHVLLGTVAGDVLREVACDVLVVPGPR
jgi:nucleotide-binding universal stress UspA family protein